MSAEKSARKPMTVYVGPTRQLILDGGRSHSNSTKTRGSWEITSRNTANLWVDVRPVPSNFFGTRTAQVPAVTLQASHGGFECPKRLSVP